MRDLHPKIPYYIERGRIIEDYVVTEPNAHCAFAGLLVFYFSLSKGYGSD